MSLKISTVSCIFICPLHMYCVGKSLQAIAQCTQLWFPMCNFVFVHVIFYNWVACGIGLEDFVHNVRDSTRATQELRNQ